MERKKTMYERYIEGEEKYGGRKRVSADLTEVMFMLAARGNMK
jgi:hypothetical protein